MSAKETLTKWIETGDTQRVLDGLMIVCKKWGHKDLATNINFQTGRYKTLQDQQAKQLISQADFQLESAKLRQALRLDWRMPRLVNQLQEDKRASEHVIVKGAKPTEQDTEI
jgi:hypothetical protein